jgi:O-antigen ligase
MWMCSLLLGFSTSPGDAVGVQSFGLPFLAIAACLVLPLTAGMLRLPVPRAIARLFGTGLALLAWMVITCSWAPEPAASFSRALLNVVCFVTLLGAVTLNRTGGDPRAWVRTGHVVVTATGMIAAYYLANLAWVASEHGLEVVVLERFVGGLMSLPWGASNTVASVLLLGIGMTLLLRREMNGRMFVFLLILQFLAVAMTFSRNGTATALLILVLGGTLREKMFLIGSVVGIAVFSLFAGSAIVDSDAISQLMENRTTGGEEITNSRVFIWHDRLSDIIEKPWISTGYYSTVHVFEYSAHNFVLNTAVEQGLVGLLLAMLLYGQLLFLTSKVDKSDKDTSMTFRMLWLAMAVNLSFEDPNFTQPFIVVFWLVVATQVLRLQSYGDHLKS